MQYKLILRYIKEKSKKISRLSRTTHNLYAKSVHALKSKNVNIINY